MSVAATPAVVDLESREWLRELHAGGATADRAVARLHALLLRAARFELSRQRASLPQVRADTAELAVEAADAALLSVLARLDDFRGDSRFTTWASKFAVLEAAVKLRLRAWHGRELPTARADSNLFADVELEPDTPSDQRELFDAVGEGFQRLTGHEHDVLVALTLSGVPIDVLAERLATTRGALYGTLHDARVKLRRHVADAGRALS